MLNRFFTFIVFIVSGFISMSSALATVGGDEVISFLGYDTKEKKVYVLRDYQDGRGNLPQLYYYNLASKMPNKLIKVNSLYINPKTKKVDHGPDAYHQVNVKLDQIKKRLVPLTPIDHSFVKLNVLGIKTKIVTAWYQQYVDGEEKKKAKIPQYHYRYTLTAASPKMKSATLNAVSYKKDLTVYQAYAIPNQNYKAVVVRYFGIDFETGYYISDPVLLVPSK